MLTYMIYIYMYYNTVDTFVKRLKPADDLQQGKPLQHKVCSSLSPRSSCRPGAVGMKMDAQLSKFSGAARHLRSNILRPLEGLARALVHASLKLNSRSHSVPIKSLKAKMAVQLSIIRELGGHLYFSNPHAHDRAQRFKQHRRIKSLKTMLLFPIQWVI